MSQKPTGLYPTSFGSTLPLELNVSGPGWADAERRIFDHPFVLVGRHESNSLRLDDPEVSRRHAYLQQLGGRVFCVDLGSRTGIRWEGEPRLAGWLRPDQKIQIGPFTLELAMDFPPEAGPGDGAAEHGNPLRDRVNDHSASPQLTVEVGNEVKSRLQMNRVMVLVGSSPECRVRLRDAGISRHHCSLVRTPEGVWVVDLLSGTGTCLNGRPIRSALLKAGDQLQVGPYTLRIWHPDVTSEQPRLGVSDIPAETPAPPATEVAVLTPEFQAELDAARERQREVEALRQQLADRQAECDRLREQVGELEVGVAGMAVLQAQLETVEARASELDSVRAERDRWQTETRDLQARLAADLHAARMEQDRLQAEQQESRHSAEQAWARVSELEHTLEEMAKGHTTTLDDARASWKSERQELEACFAQERQTHAGATESAVGEVQARVSELERTLREATEGHKTTLEEAHARWESERQELEARLFQERQTHAEAIEAAVQHSAEQARGRVSELERTLRETAEGHTTALGDARARWESERQELEARLEQARQTHAGATEDAVRDSQARLSELERTLAETAEAHKTALEEARARWELERQELEARLVQERQARAGAIEAAVGDVQARIAVEREEWRQRLEGAELQLVWERKMFQEWGEQVRQQAALVQEERNRVAVRLAQAESFLRSAEERSQAEAGTAEQQHLRQQAARELVFAEISGMRPRRPSENELPRRPASAEDKAGEDPHR
jgi:pSer/pThr/pTyr-binding forkhead associated (FHA) protein